MIVKSIQELNRDKCQAIAKMKMLQSRQKQLTDSQRSLEYKLYCHKYNIQEIRE